MGRIDRSARVTDFYSPQYKKTTTVLAVFFVLGIILSFFYLNFAWNKYEKMSSDEALVLAKSLEALINPEHLASFSGNDEDLLNPDYSIVKSNLERLTQTENQIHFAYIIEESDGNIIFLVDSEPSNSIDYSPPGQIYTEADAATYESFLSGDAVLTDPSADRWGTWISALVPIKNPDTGSTIAVFGIDFAASEWYSLIWNRMILDIIIVMCLLSLLLTLMYLGAQRSILKVVIEKLEHDEALFHAVFNQAPVGIAVVNDKHLEVARLLGQLILFPKRDQLCGTANAVI